MKITEIDPPSPITIWIVTGILVIILIFVIMYIGYITIEQAKSILANATTINETWQKIGGIINGY